MRSETLASYGVVEERDLPIALERGPGRLARLTLSFEGTTVIRLHFLVERPPAEPGWSVRLLDLSRNEVWSYSPAAQVAEFWSGEVQGSSVIVEVLSDSGARPGSLRIDRIVRSVPPITPRAITEPDQRRPITSQPDNIRTLGRSVARLRFVPDGETRSYFCTGFLVANNLIMTNRHCIQSDTEARSALIDFDYDDAAATAITVSATRVVLSDRALDFSLLELAQPAAGRVALRLTRGTVTDKQGLLVIQHPAGEPKQISLLDCCVSRAAMYGVSGAKTDFGHLCDTLGGSSGSPVLNYASLRTIGLHHLGFTEDSPVAANQAVKLPEILDHIRKKAPNLYRRLSVE